MHILFHMHEKCFDASTISEQILSVTDLKKKSHQNV